MTMMTAAHLEALSRNCSEILESAGNLLMSFFNRSFEINFKGQFNIVTEADLKSETLILNALQKLTPNIPALSEEAFQDRNPASIDLPERIWILDPLDGTTNFAHGFPHFCISLALFENESPSIALIYDPCRKEMFTAIRNQGAFLNGHPCNVSTAKTLEYSLLATGFPYRVRELEKNNLVEFCSFRFHAQGVRRAGAAALDLAYVAAGRLDGFWERWLKPWDTAAGILLVTESGGNVSHFDGSPYTVLNPEIVASNTAIHTEMLEILNRDFPQLPESLKL